VLHRRYARRAAIVRRFSMLALMLLGTVLIATGARGATPRVVVLPASGVVDQVMATYLSDGIRRAGTDGASAVLIRLDTPGGSLESTREIVKTLLDAPLPVIVWVGPSGSRAASAGTFITLAAHVAVMAPGSNIGAATPVGGQGEDIEGALGDKVLNDTVALMTGIAQQRGRNVEWAVSTIKEARSSTATEAVELKAVDGLASSVPEAVALAQGRTVQVGSQSVTVDLTGATTEERSMNALQSFLHLLADPNIAFILFTVGSYGLLYEVISPNFATGIIGGIAIILAFLGFGSLPLNVGGLLLIALAVVLFVLEVNVTSHGLLTIAGLVSLALGAGALYTEPTLPTGPSVEVAGPILVTVVGLSAAFMGLIAFVAFRTRNMPGVAQGLGGGSGGTLPVGTPAEVRRPLDPLGTVYANGEEWTARSAAGLPLERGTRARVVRQDGLTLIVEPVEAPLDRPSTAGFRPAQPL
jgi:membrane-bound serine protease (ClpP class)